MEESTDITWLEAPLIDGSGFLMLIRFAFNLLIVASVIHFFYYPRSKRKDYYFTFNLISISVFFLIFLLGSVKLKIGFALGLFAIFGIIRYRTESVPIREMTYLFVIIAISVINALAVEIGYTELFLTNLIFVIAIWISESNRWLKHISSKIILYDRIDLITPDKEELLVKDLKKRTGLSIERVEIGKIDFLCDTAVIKVYYQPPCNQINTVDSLTVIPGENK